MRARAKLLATGLINSLTKNYRSNRGESQALDIYTDESFAAILEQWGNGNVWNEIQIFLAQRQGSVLDLACGTGRVHDFLKNSLALEYYGCDISPLLIEKAIGRGIDAKRLCVTDATKLDYRNDQFDYLFSIGSLEHFTVSGIHATLSECKRVCSGLAFHMVPVSRSGFDEGWVTAGQSFWLNSESWWFQIFKGIYGDKVWSMRSSWIVQNMLGVWFITARPEYFTENKR
jgi:ubiquinone/menaquinone biosynthesis C-methylase UbiE